MLFNRYNFSDSMNLISVTLSLIFTVNEFQILALMFENVYVPGKIQIFTSRTISMNFAIFLYKEY